MIYKHTYVWIYFFDFLILLSNANRYVMFVYKYGLFPSHSFSYVYTPPKKNEHGNGKKSTS